MRHTAQTVLWKSLESLVAMSRMFGFGRSRSTAGEQSRHSLGSNEPEGPAQQDVECSEAPSAGLLKPESADPAAKQLQEEEEEERIESEEEGPELPSAFRGSAQHVSHVPQSFELPVETGQAQAVSVDQLNDQVFQELHLSSDHVHALRQSWHALATAMHSQDAVGDALLSTLMETAPSLQSHFKTARAVLSARFAVAFRNLVDKCDSPAALKVSVEMLAFLHIQVDVTAPRVWLFRDGILELLQAEIGDSFQTIDREAWSLLLSYIGGAMIFIRREYAQRFQILLSSWAKVSTKTETEKVVDEEDFAQQVKAKQSVKSTKTSDPKTPQDIHHDNKLSTMEEGGTGRHRRGFGATQVPKTFEEMFSFNAAVMGFGAETWMDDILAGFGPIVTNVANTARLQEECDVLSVIIAKRKGSIKLKDFRSVMLASLRSLLPQDWSAEYEAAWSWLWDTVEQLLKPNMGKPAAQERALRTFCEKLSEEQNFFFRSKTYEIFFGNCKQGQDYFKQSTTRMHFIADKVLSFTMDIYKDTHGVIEDLSALGLRHVGYGIPTELVGPFVSAAIEACGLLAQPVRSEGFRPRMVQCPWDASRMIAEDEIAGQAAVEAFSWSLSLVSRVLCRAITEGSTAVMKAINCDDSKMLRKAISLAPRGARAGWMLNVQVGTQQISPLMWAIQSGALEGAKAILEDLFTIRADRENYYYAVDELFSRHPDIVERICFDAPTLLPVFLDGLIWRSRLAQGGRRRANYYVKHMIVEDDGTLARSLASIVHHDDPVIICHPVNVLVQDNIWGHVGMPAFIRNRMFLVACIVIFVLSQSILVREPDFMSHPYGPIIIFVMRVWIYVLSLGSLVVKQALGTYAAFKEHDFVRFCGVPVPRYLLGWRECIGFLMMLVLFVMLLLEPTLQCFSNNKGILLFCNDVSDSIYVYRWVNMFGNLLYFALLLDLAVLSTSLSAYVLVCGRMVQEVLLCLFALLFTLITFSCVICCMKQELEDFLNVSNTALTLIRIVLGLYSGDRLNAAAEAADLFLFVSMYTVITWIFLLNLLIGQLNCIYTSSYSDMVGFARLNRGNIILETMPTVKPKTWEAYVNSLKLGEKLEFNEGDVGLAGGIQCFEPANAHRVTEEQIKRYGGSTALDIPWPEDHELASDSDKFGSMEKSLQKTLGKIWKVVGKKKGDFSGSTISGSSSVSSGSRAHSSHAGSSGDEI